MKTEILATSHDWAYIAGVIDGEGTIGYQPDSKSRNYGCVVRIYNTNQELIEWLVFKVGRGKISTKRASLKHKVCYSVGWYGEDSIIVLRQTYDYLIVKKQLAKLILEQFDYEQIMRKEKRLYYVRGYKGGIVVAEEVRMKRNMVYNKFYERKAA